MKVKDLILFIGIIAIILLLVFRGDNQPVFKVAPIEKIETRIEGKETLINTITERVIYDKSIVSGIHDEITLLRTELDAFKRDRDTVSIIQIQDTIITVLTAENVVLKSIVNDQDSIINYQRYVIDSKDTIIAVLGNDKKRFRRQRNMSILINGLLTTAVILK